MLSFHTCYNKLSYSSILIGSHLWCIGGQTHRWRLSKRWNLKQKGLFSVNFNSLLYKASRMHVAVRLFSNRDLMQPRRRRQRERNLHVWRRKNNSFARFARAFFTFFTFRRRSRSFKTWNDQFCSCVDDVSIWWQMFNFVSLSHKHRFQFNSRIVRTHFTSVMTLNNCEIIAETRSSIFGWRSRCHPRRLCLSSLIGHSGRQHMVTTSVTHSAAPRLPLFCSYHVLTSSVIYYWTDARQHGIYFLNRWWRTI